MNFLLLQTFMLLLASYFLGALLACVAKRAMYGESDAMPEASARQRYDAPVPATVRAVPSSQPARPRMTPPPVAPRPIDPVQPRIEVLRRPDPRSAPKLVDPSRFERALMGPDPNEGMPRTAILEIMPAVFKSPTGPPHPVPKPRPKDEPVAAKPAPAPVIVEAPPVSAKSSSLADTTTAAAAAAVALAKAAAAASTAAAKPEPEIVDQQEEPTDTPHVDEDVYESEVATAGDETAPAPTPAPPPVERKRIETGDDFQRIRAIDDATEQDLKTLNFTYFEDIAGWTPDDIKRIDQTLRLTGRIDKEQWVEQAQILAKGGETYYSRNRPGAQKAKTAASNLSIVETPDERPELETAPEQETTIEHKPEHGSELETLETHAEESALEAPSPVPAEPDSGEKSEDKSDPPPSMSSAFSGRSVAEMASAAAAAIAAASASVTRGLRPIEPISPLSKVDPKIVIPARLTDAIKENKAAAQAPEDELAPQQLAVAPTGPANDLKRIRGIGVLIEKRLNALGITTYEQIANWTSGDIDRVSQVLEFKGRIERETWVEQARILYGGGQTEFSRRVDRGEVDTSRET